MNTKSSVIVVYSYGLQTLDMTIHSLLRYMPPEIPICVLDTTKPGQTEKQEWIRACVNLDKNRIKYVRCSEDNPRAIGNFAEEHEEYDYIWKTDDDMFYASEGIWDGVMTALTQYPNAIIGCAFQPLQRWILPVIFDRMNIEIDERFRHPDIRHMVGHNLDMMHKLWDMTLPPEKFLKQLRAIEPRYFVLPTDIGLARHRKRFRWTACHYLIRREDLVRGCHLSFAKGSDERAIHAMRLRHKDVAIDSHSLVYHYSYKGAKSYCDEHILPRIRAMDFWRLQ